MNQPVEPDRPELPARQPTRELLLAQALDACIQAERREPGSAQALIAQQPVWARAELQQLLGLAGSLDAAATNAVMSEEFRAASRARLMARIGADAAAEVVPLPPRLSALPARGKHHRSGRSRRTWLWRGCASIFAAILGVTATLTASANALPGEPLYRLKQAREDIGVRLAGDDQARAMALLRAADARLDETGRLLQQGRTDDALLTTQRYDQAVERATTTFVVTIEDAASEARGAQHMDNTLSQQQEQLQALLQSAPEPARADLREALVATERSRALVADPRPVERALGRSNRGETPMASGKTPPLSAEELPTAVPTRRPAAAQPAPAAPTAPAMPTPVASRAIDDGSSGQPLVAQALADDVPPRDTTAGRADTTNGPLQIRRSAGPRRGDEVAAVPNPEQLTANDETPSDKTEHSAPVVVQPAFASLVSSQSTHTGAAQSQATDTRPSTGETESVRRAHQDEQVVQVVVVEPTQLPPVAQQPQPVARQQPTAATTVQSESVRATNAAASRGGDQPARPPTVTSQATAPTDRSTESSGAADAGDTRTPRPTQPAAAKPQSTSTSTSTSTAVVAAQRRSSDDSSPPKSSGSDDSSAPKSSGDARSSKAPPTTSAHSGGD